MHGKDILEVWNATFPPKVLVCLVAPCAKNEMKAWKFIVWNMSATAISHLISQTHGECLTFSSDVPIEQVIYISTVVSPNNFLDPMPLMNNK